MHIPSHKLGEIWGADHISSAEVRDDAMLRLIGKTPRRRCYTKNFRNGAIFLNKNSSKCIPFWDIFWNVRGILWQ